MSLPGLYPIYPDPVPLKYKVSLALPPIPVSKISQSVGVTASSSFLVPNTDYLQNFIKGDIGIAEKTMKEAMFKTFNNPITQKDEKIFKKFAQITNFDIPDVNQLKKDGKIVLPKDKINLPPSGDFGFKALEKTAITSIFETQKPYFEVAKLVIGNVAKIEDIVARVMPLLGVPLTTESLVPSTNIGGGNRTKAIGYQNAKELKKALAKLQKLAKTGGKAVKINKDGKAIREDIKDSKKEDPKVSDINNKSDDTNWEIISTVYSTGKYLPGVEYKYTYIDLPADEDLSDEDVDLNIGDDDPYTKYKPERIIFGIFDSKGNPLNPNSKLKSISLDSGGNVVEVETPFKKADWILRSSKWHLPENQYSWLGFAEPVYKWEKGLLTEESTTSPGDKWEIKKYKKGDKNLITGELAGKDEPMIVSFSQNDVSNYKNYFSEGVKYKMYTSEDLEKNEKITYANDIISKLNVEGHVENVFKYGQCKSSTYKEIAGKPAIPDVLRRTFQPGKVWSAEALKDAGLVKYAKMVSTDPNYAGNIWIDPEADYDMKIIRVDPTTEIEYINEQGVLSKPSPIQKYIKNRLKIKLHDDQKFNISIKYSQNYSSIESNVEEFYYDVTEYKLENWNYTNSKVNNSAGLMVTAWTDDPTFDHTDTNVWSGENKFFYEVYKSNGKWYYKKYKFKEDVTDLAILALIGYVNPVTLRNLILLYAVNPNAEYTFQVGDFTYTVKLKDFFPYRVYENIEAGDQILETDNITKVRIGNDGLVERWYCLDKVKLFGPSSKVSGENILYQSDYKSYGYLPTFGVERTFTIRTDKPNTYYDGDFQITHVDKSINIWNLNVKGDNQFGSVIDPSKIRNDHLTKDELYSNGKYGHGSDKNPQEIEVIKRYKMSDLDTESYYIIEGVLIDKKEKNTQNNQNNQNQSDEKYYRLPHAFGATKVFLSVLVDIISKMIPLMTKIIKLFKNPSSFVTEIIKEKMGDGFSIFSKDSFKTFEKAKTELSKVKDEKPSIREKRIKEVFKNSPLKNHVFVDRKGNYKFLLDGISMIPFEIFGLQIPFGMMMNFDDLSNPIKPVLSSNLKSIKFKNLQDFLKPSVKNFKTPSIDGSKPSLNVSELKELKDKPLYKKANDPIKYKNPNDEFDIIDTKYSTGAFISGVDYEYIFINENTNNLLKKSEDIVAKNNDEVDPIEAQKNLEELNDELKKDPKNKAIRDAIVKLKNKIRGLSDNNQPILKLLLGLVTLPMKIIGKIIEWLMDFFKSLANPLTLPSKVVELLSFSWLMEIFTPVGLLKLAGVKYNPKKIAEWCALVKIPNAKPPNVSVPNELNGVNLPELKYYKDANPKGKYLIPDDYEIADWNEVLSAPFMPKLPVYTARMHREMCNRPLKVLMPNLCLLEKVLNGVIDFIWSTLGIEAFIKPPHIKLCSGTESVDDAIKLSNDLNKDSFDANSNSGNTTTDQSLNSGNSNISDDAEFLYDITLSDGTVLRDLNYEQMQKYIKEHENIGYDFKF